MEVGGWVQVSLGFHFGKSSQNSSKLFWSSIPYVSTAVIINPKSEMTFLS